MVENDVASGKYEYIHRRLYVHIYMYIVCVCTCTCTWTPTCIYTYIYMHVIAWRHLSNYKMGTMLSDVSNLVESARNYTVVNDYCFRQMYCQHATWQSYMY